MLSWRQCRPVLNVEQSQLKRVCVGFLQAERKDDRIGKKEETPKRAEGEKQMLAECESRWTKLAQEVLSGMSDWRVEKPPGGGFTIEEALDKSMAGMTG